MCKLSLILFCLLLSSGARAYDIYPEYQGFSEAEMEYLGSPGAVDSEYQSLVSTYSPDLLWERQWAGHARAYDLSVGSLSNKHFFLYSRLKTEMPLTQSWRLNFIYFSQRDRETDQVRHILELTKKIAPTVDLHFYGEPSLFKRETDLGMALTWRATHALSTRLYVTSHDITRNDHTDRQDSFKARRNPHSIGLSSQWKSADLSLSTGVRYDTPTDWIQPLDEVSKRYQKQVLFANALLDLPNKQSFSGRVQWDVTTKSQESLPDGGKTAEQSWYARRLQSELQWTHGLESDQWRFVSGFTHASREWRNAKGQQLSHFNEMPSATIRRRGPRRSDGFDTLQLEYELTVFRAFGDAELMPIQNRDRLESRLQTAYEFKLRGSSRLLLALNFDLDEASPVPTFEGGHAMFRADF